MKKQRVFFDMDGTMAKWKEATAIEEMYEKGFFAELEPHNNVIEMVNNLADHPKYEVYILTAYFTDSNYAKAEKLQWNKKYAPKIDKKHIIFCPCGTNKSKWVPGGIRATDILLDDYTFNLNDWVKSGGIAIKLRNGINGTKGTWQGPAINCYEHGHLVSDKDLEYEFLTLIDEETK